MKRVIRPSAPSAKQDINWPLQAFATTLTAEHLARDITGCAVKADARGMDVGITTIGPIDEGRHRVQQGLA